MSLPYRLSTRETFCDYCIVDYGKYLNPCIDHGRPCDTLTFHAHTERRALGRDCRHNKQLPYESATVCKARLIAVLGLVGDRRLLSRIDGTQLSTKRLAGWRVACSRETREGGNTKKFQITR